MIQVCMIQIQVLYLIIIIFLIFFSPNYITAERFSSNNDESNSKENNSRYNKFHSRNLKSSTSESSNKRNKIPQIRQNQINKNNSPAPFDESMFNYVRKYKPYKENQSREVFYKNQELKNLEEEKLELLQKNNKQNRSVSFMENKNTFDMYGNNWIPSYDNRGKIPNFQRMNPRYSSRRGSNFVNKRKIRKMRLEQRFEKFSLFHDKEPNCNFRKSMNPLEKLLSNDANEKFRSTLNNWASEAIFRHEAKLNKTSRIDRNPYEIPEFRRPVFKFFLNIPEDALDIFKKARRPQLLSFGYNPILALDMFKSIEPEDIRVMMLNQVGKVLMSLAEDDVWKIEKISRFVGEKLKKLNLSGIDLVNMLYAPMGIYEFEGAFWKSKDDRRKIIKFFLRNLSKDIKLKISQNLESFLKSKIKSLNGKDHELMDFKIKSNYNNFSDNLWDSNKDKFDVIITMRKIVTNVV